MQRKNGLTRLYQTIAFLLAQKAGFEPALQFSHTTPLAGEPLEPLGYFCTAHFTKAILLYHIFYFLSKLFEGKSQKSFYFLSPTSYHTAYQQFPFVDKSHDKRNAPLQQSPFQSNEYAPSKSFHNDKFSQNAQKHHSPTNEFVNDFEKESTHTRKAKFTPVLAKKTKLAPYFQGKPAFLFVL